MIFRGDVIEERKAARNELCQEGIWLMNQYLNAAVLLKSQMCKGILSFMAELKREQQGDLLAAAADLKDVGRLASRYYSISDDTIEDGGFTEVFESRLRTMRMGLNNALTQPYQVSFEKPKSLLEMGIAHPEFRDSQNSIMNGFQKAFKNFCNVEKFIADELVDYFLLYKEPYDKMFPSEVTDTFVELYNIREKMDDLRERMIEKGFLNAEHELV